MHIGPAVTRNPQPNYVTKKPGPPRTKPFRPTTSREEYEAVKARANSYNSEAEPPLAEVFSPATVPHIKSWNFNGHSMTDGWIPPDTHGALGTSHYVEVTNTHIDMYERGTPPFLVKSMTMADSFQYYTVDQLTDPRVVYDSTWNRWIVIILACPESTRKQLLLTAVSTTADPTSDWYVFLNNNVTVSEGDFFDFPQLGIDQDAVLFTGNVFADVTCEDPFGINLGATFFAVAKAKLYNGIEDWKWRYVLAASDSREEATTFKHPDFIASFTEKVNGAHPWNGHLRSLLSALPVAQRRLIEQLFWEERTETEVASTLSINQSTINRRKQANEARS